MSQRQEIQQRLRAEVSWNVKLPLAKTTGAFLELLLK